MFKDGNISEVKGRYERFAAIFNPITDDHAHTAVLMRETLFDPEVFKRYEGNVERIKKYLLMQRWYIYQQFCWFTDRAGEGLFIVIDYDRFIAELCEISEFRDVHIFYGKYVPEYAAYIEKGLAKTKHRAQQREFLKAYGQGSNSIRSRVSGKVSDVLRQFEEAPVEEQLALAEVIDILDRNWESLSLLVGDHA